MILRRPILLIAVLSVSLWFSACRASAPASPSPTLAPATATSLLSPAPATVIPTVTLPPTTPPTASPKVTPTQATLLSGPPESYLPAEDDLPPDLVLQLASSGTNQEIAEQYENPADVLEQLEAWGRLSNFMQVYAHKTGCEAQALRDIYLQVVLYETAEGAGKALEWYIERNRETALQVETTSAVGESGYILWLNQTSACTPPDALSVVSIGFRRHNALGFVDVSRTPTAPLDTNLQTLALRLAQLIDYHFFEDSK